MVFLERKSKAPLSRIADECHFASLVDAKLWGESESEDDPEMSRAGYDAPHWVLDAPEQLEA